MAVFRSTYKPVLGLLMVVLKYLHHFGKQVSLRILSYLWANVFLAEISVKFSWFIFICVCFYDRGVSLFHCIILCRFCIIVTKLSLEVKNRKLLRPLHIMSQLVLHWLKYEPTRNWRGNGYRTREQI